MGADRGMSGVGRRDGLVNGVVASSLVPRRLRWRLLKVLGLDVAASTVDPQVYFGGRDVSIGEGAYFDAVAPIYVGNGVRIGSGVRIVTGRTVLGDVPSRDGGHVTASPVLIGAGARIGAGAVILPGVTVGEGAVIAADAVVVENCLPNSVYAGNPARLVEKS
ncbi:acyltransferase [Gordonia jinghuaiqii]|uniref:Acyltransferase n=1 Tax=Gordonia jinghuaiqii TaxID=2758710 RepID=A0A7D7QZ00_9ACTN|nr:DapH/DapD/GlmU-related protein [Gordonia jinghuaiqii]MCR5977934.1 acyltransferase [Gordonia jinghuaiqii]QMT02588.1 acyltransferase [Gordonia jinghuaiqii]